MSDASVYFEEGFGADMGIFEGYGAGWYVKVGNEEAGPFDTEDDAWDYVDQWREDN